MRWLRLRALSVAGSLAIAGLLVLIAKSRRWDDALMAAQADLDDATELAALLNLRGWSW